jgi:hypothetical protein
MLSSRESVAKTPVRPQLSETPLRSASSLSSAGCLPPKMATTFSWREKSGGADVAHVPFIYVRSGHSSLIFEFSGLFRRNHRGPFKILPSPWRTQILVKRCQLSFPPLIVKMKTRGAGMAEGCQTLLAPQSASHCCSRLTTTQQDKRGLFSAVFQLSRTQLHASAFQ